MATPNMSTITASLEKSLKNCSLSTNQHTNGDTTGLPPDNSPEGDPIVELCSESLPYHWEQCLDLKVQFNSIQLNRSQNYKFQFSFIYGFPFHLMQVLTDLALLPVSCFSPKFPFLYLLLPPLLLHYYCASLCSPLIVVFIYVQLSPIFVKCKHSNSTFFFPSFLTDVATCV